MDASVATVGHRTGPAILGRIIRPDDPTLSPEAARSILRLTFDPEDRERVATLLEANQGGGLSPEGRAELDEFLRADLFLSLLQAKARLSLKRAGLAP